MGTRRASLSRASAAARPASSAATSAAASADATTWGRPAMAASAISVHILLNCPTVDLNMPSWMSLPAPTLQRLSSSWALSVVVSSSASVSVRTVFRFSIMTSHVNLDVASITASTFESRGWRGRPPGWNASAAMAWARGKASMSSSKMHTPERRSGRAT